MKRLLCATLLLSVSATGANASANALTVAVAANVQFAFEELRTEFKSESGIVVQPVIGSSGKLTAQAKAGAPYDLFLSANMAYPRALHKAGLAIAEPKIYAYGTLVLWTLSNVDLGKGLAVVTDPEVHQVAIANPGLAPYGQEALRALSFYHLDRATQPKLVYGESISQVNQYIHSRVVDVGLTAKSVVLSPKMKGQGRWVEVPSGSYSPIAQGVVILKHGYEAHPRLAREFLRFLASAKAREILKRYGYGLP
ncbi:MAG: molybdate ABC transporter substrate-binding protein [Acidiferrobacteraceae bacterium]|jgi:molybdate transport system substrate-binding protein